MTVHPVTDALLRAVASVGLAKAPMRERGRYYHGHRAILLRHGLTRGQWNAAAAHEAIHALNGDEACASPELDARQEQAVDREAAFWLIDIKDLADAAVTYPDDPHQVAEALDVDLHLLTVRMKHLHPSERHYLRRRMAMVTGEQDQ